MTEEEQIAYAIALSQGENPPPLSSGSRRREQPPLFDVDVKEDAADNEDDHEDRYLPDFSSEAEVDAYWARKHGNFAERSPTSHASVSELGGALRPIQHENWGDALGAADFGGGVSQEPEMDAELRHAMKRSEDEQADLAASRRAAEEEEEQLKLALAASLAPPSPKPPASDDIDSEEEERFNADLRRAIEASRQASQPGPSRAGASSSSRTIASNDLSPPSPPAQRVIPKVERSAQLDRPSTSAPAAAAIAPAATDADAAPADVVRPSLIFGGLSRAQMEAERLSRVRKRQLSASSSTDAASQPSPAKKPRPPVVVSTSRVTTLADLPADGSSSTTPGSSGGVGSVGARPMKEVGAMSDRYWDGELRWTRNSVVKDEGKCFSIKHLIGNASDLEQAIVSTYCHEPEFVFSLFPNGETVPIILVSQPTSSDCVKKSYLGREVPGLWSCYPYLPVAGYGLRGTCHMKFMLLWYKDGRLRVIISTANLMEHDFTAIENGIWVQDFKPLKSRPSENSDFGSQWEFILQELNISNALKEVLPSFPSSQRARLPFKALADIHKYDFSRVVIQLVASTHGKKELEHNMEKVGQARLGKVLREAGWVPNAQQRLASLECQGSSLGMYTLKWVNTFWKFAAGMHPQEWLDHNNHQGNVYPPVKILYPSLATVDNSALGKPGGGTMFCDRKKWALAKDLLYDSNSKRGPVLMHIKEILAIFEPIPKAAASALAPPAAPAAEVIEIDSDDSETEDEEYYLPHRIAERAQIKAAKVKATPKAKEEPKEKNVGGWIYFGSHNFTPSAWGTVSSPKGVPTIYCANYELGIAFPLLGPKTITEQQADRLTTWKRPARKYTDKDVPWMQFEHNER